ncbi:MAG: hypothetical protein IKW19_09720, partial [Akkermansia sp.]|nr:hypothetical protein [Akkermansia sp.]
NRIDIAPGAGQVYQFYIGDGSDGGITAVEDGIHITSGTVIFGTSTLDMAQDTTISVKDGVLALEAGAMSQQEYVDIELLHGSTLRWQAGNTDDYTRNGGLSVAQGAFVTLDMGANAVKLSEGIIGAVAGTTIQLYGTAGQDIAVSSGVLGAADVYLNGVDLALEAGAQYGFSLSNNTDNYHTEEVTIAASAAGEAKKTTLSGDNSAYQGEVEIGINTTLELASAKALGADMALTGAGHVAYTAGGAAQNISYTLTTDDTYTGTTTVGKGTTLNWGGATNARSGAIKLDNGSTLVLNCGVANAISDGLDSAGLAKGGVTITSLRDEDDAIIPVVWNNAGKTYTGLTTISNNTIVVASNPLSSGLGSNVNLSGTGSILRITNAGNFSTGSNPHYISGAGVVELDLSGEYSMGSGQKWLESVVDLNGTGFGTLRLASGTTLNVGTTSFNSRFAKISEFDVLSGACLVYDENLNWTAAQTLHLAGSGIANSTNASRKAALSFIRGDKNIASKVNLRDNASVYTGSGCTNTLSGAVSLNDKTLTKVGAGVLKVTGSMSNGNVDVTEGTMEITGKMKDVDTIYVVDSTLKLTGANAMYLADGSSDGAADIVVSETSGKNAELAFSGINGSTTWKGDITLQNGTLFNILCYGYTHDFEGLTTFGETDSDVTELQTNIGHTVRLASMAGKGTLMLTRSNTWLGENPNNSSLVLTGENSFAGTIVLDGTENPTGYAANKDTEQFTWKVEAQHTNALKSATVQFNKTAAELSLQTAVVNAEGIKSAVNGKGKVTTTTAGNTLKITNTATEGVEFSGVIGNGVNVEIAGGYQKLGSANQTGTHVFTATGGTLDMGGYTRAAGATGADTIIANGGTIKDLT